MNVRDFEGWLAALLDQQPWVTQTVRWSPGGGPKPVGLTLNGTLRMQLVGGDQKAPPLDHNGTAPLVEANPSSPVDWAAAVTRAVTAANLRRITTAETYAQWGHSSKPAGMRVGFTDGSEIFASVLTGR